MRVKTSVSDIRLGMFVAELDRPWLGTRFLFQGFTVSNDETLEELRRVCEHVYIETEERYQDAGRAPRQPLMASAGARAPAETPDRLLRDSPVNKRWHPDQTTLAQEIDQAFAIERQARETVYSILDDARLGKSIDTFAAKRVVADMAESIIRNPDAMVVLSQLKKVDEYTALHSLRVCILALTFGRHLEMSREELNLLGLGALLHDVGKMKVPLDILNKPDRLTDQEFEIIKSHVPRGMEILLDARGLPLPSLQVAERHHERYNGTGYARGFAGDAIGAFGMIAAIVDCYDAITSDRVYRRGMTAHEALTRMYEWRTKDFHPGLVEQFIQCMGIYPIGSIVELRTGAVGVVITVNRERRLKPKVVLVLNADKKHYKKPKTIDLWDQEQQNPGSAIEISKVLPGGSYGISPTDYLPVQQLLEN